MKGEQRAINDRVRLIFMIISDSIKLRRVKLITNCDYQKTQIKNPALNKQHN